MNVGSVLEGLFTQNQFMAAIIVDNKGTVLSVSETYLQVLNLSKEEVVGKPIREVTPHTRVFTVLETGRAIVGYNWKVNGRDMIASTIPIIKNGKTIGAFAYSVFPDIWDAKNMVENLLSELNMYRDEVDSLYTAKYTFDDIIGSDKSMELLKSFARQIANHHSTNVLITGESGTGKDLLANAIHNASTRSRFPFLRINCAAIPENLLEAELFGYEEGAYTGAKKGGKPGKFEIAHGGTIFLDEIGEMSLSMQSKLLIVLQEQIIERLGGSYPIKVNVRVIAATNRSLEQLIQENKFREDLYYRLNVVRLEVPPLRQRKQDISTLIQHFIEKLNPRLRTDIADVSKISLQLLEQYHWPGNIREMENMLERAIIMADMENVRSLDCRHFKFLQDRCSNRAPLELLSLREASQKFEEELIIRALGVSDNNLAKAAEQLEIDLSTLYKKIKRYDIEI